MQINPDPALGAKGNLLALIVAANPSLDGVVTADSFDVTSVTADTSVVNTNTATVITAAEESGQTGSQTFHYRRQNITDQVAESPASGTVTWNASDFGGDFDERAINDAIVNQLGLIGSELTMTGWQTEPDPGNPTLIPLVLTVNAASPIYVEGQTYNFSFEWSA